jgi:hypothetical protein
MTPSVLVLDHTATEEFLSEPEVERKGTILPELCVQHNVRCGGVEQENNNKR